MIVRIQVSEEVAFAGVCWWLKNKKAGIKSYYVFKNVVHSYVEIYGTVHSAVVSDQEIYHRALAIVKKYYHKTKGGKNMSNTEVSEDPKTVVNGGEETADQETKPTVDEKTTEDTSATKPIND